MVTDERPVADTPLARWLTQRMNQWEDPVTRMKGLSVNRLAALAGVSQTVVWRAVKQGETPKASVLMQIAPVFDVSPMLLFRLAYQPQTEDEDFDPEVRAALEELEDTLARLPLLVQLEVVEALNVQAQAHLAAAGAWSAAEQQQRAEEPAAVSK
jgi:transcriptional regulator with XRE-family HTH domain